MTRVAVLRSCRSIMKGTLLCLLLGTTLTACTLHLGTLGLAGTPSPDWPLMVLARNVEGHIMEHARDTIMVLVKASAEVIASRMEENPQPMGALRREHIELVLRRFEEEHSRSLIRYKFALDTSTSTAEKTFQEFLTNVQPLLRESDQIRILARRAMEQGG